MIDKPETLIQFKFDKEVENSANLVVFCHHGPRAFAALRISCVRTF